MPTPPAPDAWESARLRRLLQARSFINISNLIHAHQAQVTQTVGRFVAQGVNVTEEYIPAHLVVGSMPPSGYIAWHEWAEAQGKGGLKQSQCGECGLWFFPQEAINHAPNKACTRRAKVGAQKVSSKSKRSVKSARG